jgi:hypothetical protein
MYKKSSHNQQSRTERTAEFGTRNNGGVDPTAFAVDYDTERNRLLCRKLDVEDGIRSAKQREVSAMAAHRAHRETALSYQMFKKIQQDIVDLQTELRDIEKSLMRLKQERRTFEIGRQHSTREKRVGFDAAFHMMAKSILARPVYERVMIAAIHYLGEEDENSGRGS